MSAALAVTPASGSITAATTVVRVDVTGGDNTVKQRVKAECTGAETLLSHEFEPSSDGAHSWFSIMFPVAGSWTLTLYNTANDAQLATLAVTVA